MLIATSIVICLLVVFILWLGFAWKKAHRSKKQALIKQAEQKITTASLVEDFSGDNRCDTELDLAQAYLELHQYEKTKHLLKSVITHGQPHQILEARKMFTLLLKQERTL